MRFNSLASAAAIAVTVAGLAGFSGAANAESNIGANSANASLDFQVNIPGIVFLQVGTGTFRQNVTTVNQLVFSPTAEQVVDNTPVAAASGGDVSPGVVTVRVWGNVGQLRLSSASQGQLSNGSDTIPWSEISVTASNADLPHPAFDAAGFMETNLQTLGNGNSRVTNVQGNWAYTFANSAEPAQGTYNGRVTYTVANP